MSETELHAEVLRLTTLNDRLARQIVTMADTLETGRRELLATGWDAAVNEANRRWSIGHASAAFLKADNPYRKPALDFSGAIACKVDDE